MGNARVVLGGKCSGPKDTKTRNLILSPRPCAQECFVDNRRYRRSPPKNGFTDKKREMHHVMAPPRTLTPLRILSCAPEAALSRMAFFPLTTPDGEFLKSLRMTIFPWTSM